MALNRRAGARDQVPGFQEWIVIAFVALIVLGPDRLPRVAQTAGRLVARFRSETRRNVEELKRVAEIQDLERELQGLRQELRGTRDDVVRRAGGSRPGPASRSGRRGAGGGQGSGGAGRPLVRPDDAPPPIDPEAT